jgi:hypothetical protein
MRRVWVVIGALVILVAAGAGLFAYSDLRSSRDDAQLKLSGVRAETEQLMEELESSRQRLSSSLNRSEKLREELRLARDEVRQLSGSVREAFFLLQEGESAGSCAGHVIGEVGVRIVEPRPRARVSSPVVMHLVVDDPVGCDATYFVTIDDIPYQQVYYSGQGDPTTGEHPLHGRPRPQLPRHRWTDMCITSVFYDYWSFRLPSGEHTIRINGGCPQGTDVPNTRPTEVTFSVPS